MKSRRLNRINHLLRMELGALILQGLRDPRLAQVVSVTAVSVAPDLGSAKVYVSVLGTRDEKEQTLIAFRTASGFLRKELGRRVALRSIPELRFLLDDSIEEGAGVLSLLQEMGATSEARVEGAR